MAQTVALTPIAQAWLDAASDLGIRVERPFTMTTRRGVIVTTQGVCLPDFGSAAGTLLLCRLDSDEVYELADGIPYYRSGLSPRYYEPYRRGRYIDTLNDWGWRSPAASRPAWYTGAPWTTT